MLVREKSAFAIDVAREGWLAAALIVASGFALTVIVLLLPISLPIGFAYWDTIIHMDGAYRIDYGQRPHADFFSPYGPMPIYFYWLAKSIFPNTHPVLGAQISYALVLLPLLGLVLADIRSTTARALIGVLLILFLFLPVNLFYQRLYIGVDGFALYNRQAGLLMYVLVGAIWWSRSPLRFGIVAAVTLVALFFTKITTFAIAVPLLAFAFFYQTFGWRTYAAIAAAVLASIALVETTTGVASAYLRDIGMMIEVNAGGNLPRLQAIGSTNLQLLLILALVGLALAVHERRRLSLLFALAWRRPVASFTTLVRSPPVAFAVLCIAALMIELQNTGSHEFAFMIPAVVRLLAPDGEIADTRAAKLVALFAVVFIAAVGMRAVERGVRIAIAAIGQAPIAADELAALRIGTKPSFLADGRNLLDVYADESGFFSRLAERANLTRAGYEQSPPAPYDVDVHFQVAYFLSVAEAVRALRQRQRESRRPLNSLHTFDFADPFPLLTGIAPTPALSVNYSIGRVAPLMGVYPPESLSTRYRNRLIAALSDVDGILVPKCPAMIMRNLIVDMLRPALEGRNAEPLTRCWTLYVKPA